MSIRYMNGPIGIIFNRLKEKKMLLYKSKQHRELRQKTPTSMNFNLQDNVSNFLISHQNFVKAKKNKYHYVLTISFGLFSSFITPLVFFIIDGIIRFVLNLPFGLFALFFGFTSPLSSFFGILSLTGEKISCI